MEEGVINEMLKSELGELFDERQMLNDVSGSGNNWAHGFCYYGPKFENHILEKIRKAVEETDSLQSFFLIHSLGGGTGSGLGTYLLHEVFRFATSVFPSKDDDVITSPYNSMLSLNELSKHADCVLPIDNNALMALCNKVQNPTKSKMPTLNSNPVNKGSKITEIGEKSELKKERPFDKMNNIVAHLLSNLTSSMRFEGILNIDLNEITMNLVPYPNLHFLISSVSPLVSLLDKKFEPRSIDEIFKDCTLPENQLICSNPLKYRYTALGLITRGNITFADVNRNIKKLKDSLNLIYWNTEGFKYGICNAPPINQPYSLLCLANNTCIRNNFEEMIERFMKLYKRRAHIHHYTEYIDIAYFDEMQNNITSLIESYKELERVEPPEEFERIKPLI